MGVRKLRKLDEGDYGVTLPAKQLQLIGAIDSAGERVDDDQMVRLEDRGPGAWYVELVGDFEYGDPVPAEPGTTELTEGEQRALSHGDD